MDKLDDPEQGAAAVLTLIDRLRGMRGDAATPRVFLSYAWKRSDYADLVEAVLRRQGQVTVFRDERDIAQGERIDKHIEEEITGKCDLFIALWGCEYVTSPYCYDEMDTWIQHRGADHLYLLRLDDTRRVWPSLRSAPTDRQTFLAKWPVVGADRVHVQAAVLDILQNYQKRVGDPPNAGGPPRTVG